jgi:hypothetical protein
MFFISGKVRDGTSGLPLPGASVHALQVHGEEKHKKNCSLNGRYSIPTAHRGIYVVFARASGYNEASKVVNISPKQDQYDVDFELWPVPHPAPIFVDFGKVLLTLNAGALVLMNTFVLNAQLNTNQKSIAAIGITSFALGLAAFLAAYFLNLAATHDPTKRVNKRWVTAAKAIPNLAMGLFALGFALSTALALWILLADPPPTPLTNPW